MITDLSIIKSNQEHFSFIVEKEKELKDAEEARKKAMEAQLNTSASKPGGRRKKL